MLYFAPLQGFTDYIYRKAFASNFGGIDAFFIPYISLNSKKPVQKQLIDLLPENNEGVNVTPQILFKNEKEISELTKILMDIGYSEINLNLGCPYPMVTKRGMGSGLLSRPEELRQILSVCGNFSNIRFSVKMRSGLNNEDEIFDVIKILNEFEFSEIIYHSRVAKQLYKGKTNDNLALQVIELSKHKIVINGDIDSLEVFTKKKDNFSNTEKWMLGRGVLKNPFLAEEIKGIQTAENEKLNRLSSFHDELFKKYSEKLSGDGHVLTKLKQFWQYFSFAFENQHKIFKLIKKAGKTNDYQAATSKIFSGEFKPI